MGGEEKKKEFWKYRWEHWSPTQMLHILGLSRPANPNILIKFEQLYHWVALQSPGFPKWTATITVLLLKIAVKMLTWPDSASCGGRAPQDAVALASFCSSGSSAVFAGALKSWKWLLSFVAVRREECRWICTLLPPPLLLCQVNNHGIYMW